MVALGSRLMRLDFSVHGLFLLAVVNADRGGDHFLESGGEWLLVDQNILDVVLEVGSEVRQEGTVVPAGRGEESCDTLEFGGIGGDRASLAEGSEFPFHCAG